MKILILSSSNPQKASGRVAFDIYKGLSQIKGNTVNLFVKPWSNINDDCILSMESFVETAIDKIRRNLKKKIINIFYARKQNQKYQVQNFDQTIDNFKTSKFLNKLKFIPDVVIVLFMTKFITYRNLAEIHKNTGAKIFLLPMDMAPFTGICHYPWDCHKFFLNCGCCPALDSKNPQDQSFKNLEFKKQYVSKCQIEALVGTNIAYNLVKKSALFKDKQVHKGIFLFPNIHIYKRDGLDLRNLLNIEHDMLVFLIGSVSNSDKRKGMHVLKNALDQIVENNNLIKNLCFLIIGNCDEKFWNIGPFRKIHLGYIKNQHELATIYRTANFFISPSIEDSGPTMVLQSMLCGTPVIAFNIGFANQFIADGENGLVANIKTANELAIKITQAITLSSDKYEKMKHNLDLYYNYVKDYNIFEKIIQTINC